MRIAVVGCGNIAPFYFSTLPLYSELQVMGVMDEVDERSTKLSAYFSVPKYDSLEQVLDDDKVELIVNLTNPRSHYSVSKASLEAGKHVYSEKPLAMSFSEAEELVELAKTKGLRISSAPSRILADTGQTMWKALREEAIGAVRLVYGEMDGGLIHIMRYKEWTNELGVPWPYRDEFEVGCTVEHAGYVVTLLTAFFGQVDTVTTFASCQVPDKLSPDEEPLEVNSADVTVACLKFRSGVVARLTCSWLAPTDHSIRVFGDRGIMYTPDIWRPRSPIFIRRYVPIRRSTWLSPWRQRYPLLTPPGARSGARRMALSSPGAFLKAVRNRARHFRKRVDFCLGIEELAAAIREGRPSRLSDKYCLHNTEIVLAIHEALDGASTYKIKTSIEPMDPMPWAMEAAPSVSAG